MMGTGTTGIAALKLKRQFLGMEKDVETFGDAKRNISTIPDMLPVIIIFPTRKIVIETFCPVFYVLDESFHQILQFTIINLMF
jgi:DNA modification methylase